MRPINEIIVHCTATPEGRPVSVTEINTWHKARGWSGIGYHRVISLTGERWAGRAIEEIGAHCEGHNAGTVGVTYVGGVAADGKTPKDTRNQAQKSALLAELIDLRDRFHITKISGHRDYAAKACPSFDATAEYAPLLIAVPGHHEPIVDELLERGDVGPAVAEWRSQLSRYRKLIGYAFAAGDGPVFDHSLELITLWFQEKRGIKRDGKVGPQTRLEMDRALASQPPFAAMG